MTRNVAGLCFSLAFTVALVGCNQLASDEETEEFRNGVPRAETIRMSFPGADTTGQALTESSGQNLAVESASQALLGETAEWYKITRKVTRSVNGAALVVGALVGNVLRYPPTSLDQNEAVWGPWEDPLDPVAWKVTITRVAAHTFHYAFEGRPKNDPSAAFVTVLAGTHTPALNTRGRPLPRFGSGSFTLDWDARATLPQPDDNVGKVDYSYEHLSAADPVAITASFRQVKDEDRPGQKLDAKYAFAQQPQGPGSMDFAFDIPATANQEGGRGLVHSRWQFSGAGRSDVQAKALQSGVTLSISECWDVTYASVYKQDSWLGGESWGSESDCAFPTAEYSSLQ